MDHGLRKLDEPDLAAWSVCCPILLSIIAVCIASGSLIAAQVFTPALICAAPNATMLAPTLSQAMHQDEYGEAKYTFILSISIALMCVIAAVLIFNCGSWGKRFMSKDSIAQQVQLNNAILLAMATFVLAILAMPTTEGYGCQRDQWELLQNQKLAFHAISVGGIFGISIGGTVWQLYRAGTGDLRKVFNSAFNVCEFLKATPSEIRRRAANADYEALNQPVQPASVRAEAKLAEIDLKLAKLERRRREHELQSALEEVEKLETEEKEAMAKRCQQELEDSTVSLTFQPGPAGFDMRMSTSSIFKLHKDGQAESLGVRKGWTISELDGQPYSVDLMRDKIAGKHPYQITFVKGAVPRRRAYQGLRHQPIDAPTENRSQRTLAQRSASVEKANHRADLPRAKALSDARGNVAAAQDTIERMDADITAQTEKNNQSTLPREPGNVGIGGRNGALAVLIAIFEVLGFVTFVAFYIVSSCAEDVCDSACTERGHIPVCPGLEVTDNISMNAELGAFGVAPPRKMSIIEDLDPQGAPSDVPTSHFAFAYAESWCESDTRFDTCEASDCHMVGFDTLSACEEACIEDAQCNFFLWGTTMNGIPRCATFEDCSRRSPYLGSKTSVLSGSASVYRKITTTTTTTDTTTTTVTTTTSTTGTTTTTTTATATTVSTTTTTAATTSTKASFAATSTKLSTTKIPATSTSTSTTSSTMTTITYTRTVTSTTTTNQKGATQSVIEGSLVVNNVNFAALQSNPSLELEFVRTCQQSIATAAGTDPSIVAVTLSAGSVNIAYTITVPENERSSVATALTTSISSSGSSPMATSLVSSLSVISGIDATMSGSLAATGFTTPAITTVQVTMTSSNRTGSSTSETSATETSRITVTSITETNSTSTTGTPTSTRTTRTTTLQIGSLGSRSPRTGQASLIIGASLACGLVILGAVGAHYLHRFLRRLALGPSKDVVEPSVHDLEAQHYRDTPNVESEQPNHDEHNQDTPNLKSEQQNLDEHYRGMPNVDDLEAQIKDSKTSLAFKTISV